MDERIRGGEAAQLVLDALVRRVTPSLLDLDFGRTEIRPNHYREFNDCTGEEVAVTEELKTILAALTAITFIILLARFGGAFVARTTVARCRDGSLSSSRCRRGTCSHHGGVRIWLSPT